MKVTLKNEKKVAVLEIPEATDAQITNVLYRAIAYVQGQETVSVQQAPTSAPKNVITEESKQRVVQKLAAAVAADAAGRPKTLPKVNEERTLFTNLGEQFGDKLANLKLEDSEPEEKPDYWETGIMTKVFDGEEVPTYRTYYRCPNGHKGKRYIKEHTDFVHCHTCNTKIGVRFAHEHGFPHRDDFGNFYVADLPYDEEHIQEAADSE